MTAVSTVLAVLLVVIVVAVAAVLFTTPRRVAPVSVPEVDPIDAHFATAAALLQPDAPITPVWATALFAEIAALPTTADPEVTR